MIVARRLVRDRLQSLRWWSLGLAALVLSTVGFYPSIKGSTSFEELTRDLPEALTSLFALDSGIGITSAPGYLHARLFSGVLPLVLIIFAIGIGTRAIAGAEEDGTLELTLARPISRVGLALGRYCATTALVTVLTLFTVMAVAVSSALVGALDGVSVTGLVVECLGAGSLAVLHGTVAYSLGAATGRRALALATATTLGVAGFLLNGLLALSKPLERLRVVIPWHWYLERNMLAEGPAFKAIVVPLAVSAVLVVLGVARFARRDLR